MFDVRLGRREDSPEEQVLALWPPSPADISQKDFDVVRLARGVLGLCTHFTQAAECESITFGHHTITITPWEPSVYCALFSPSALDTQIICPAQARQLLASLHSLFVLMHGSLHDCVARCGLITTRHSLSAHLEHTMPAIVHSEGWATLRDAYTPLSPHRGLPLLRLPLPLFQGIHTMASAFAVSPMLPGRPVVGCQILFKQSLLYSTVSAQDSAALYHLASLSVIPLTRTANKATEISRLYHSVKQSYEGQQMPATSLLRAAAWHHCKGGEQKHFVLCSGAGEGTSERAGMLENPDCCLLLRLGGSEACRLVVWQLDGLLILLLVAGSAPITAADLASIQAGLQRPLADLDLCAVRAAPAPIKVAQAERGQTAAAALARFVDAHKKGHLPGHRYTMTDSVAATPLCVSSPVSKFSKCSQTSVALMSQLWDDALRHIRLEHVRACSATENAGHGEKLPVSSASSGVGAVKQDGSVERLEVVVLGPHKGWLAARWGGGCEHLHLLEIQGDVGGFPQVGRELDSFVNSHFPGALGPALGPVSGTK